MGTMIYVNRSDSACGNCGKPANLFEPGHITVPGYRKSGPGCGEEWIGVSSHYTGLPQRWVSNGIWNGALAGLPVYEFGKFIGYVGGGNGSE